MLIQRRGNKALRPCFRDCIFVPYLFDSLEATLCDRHNSSDVLRFLTLDPRLQFCDHLLCGNVSDLIDLGFKFRFHFLNDLLPRCFNQGCILFPVLTGSALKNSGTGDAVFVCQLA